jgi:hypothetical protein
MKRQVARLIRRLLVRHVRAAAPRPQPFERPRVTILLSTAWGMGGTVRTTLHLARRLAARYDVQIISVGRGRENPFFGEFPSGVSVIALDDLRPSRRPGRAEPLRRLLRSPANAPRAASTSGWT